MTILPITETGPPEAPPLVLLHGFLGRAADWDAVAERLAPSFRCVAVELPGHGRAADAPDAAFSWDGALDAIAATLDAHGVRRCRMVGYSMGGRLALGFALRHPGRLARLVVAGASPGLRSEMERVARRALDTERAAALRIAPEAFLHVWTRMPLFASLTDAQRDRLVADRLRHDPEALARALDAFSPGRMPDLWPHLDRLGAPTLALAAAHDAKFVGLVHRMAAEGRPVIPDTIPEAGHAVLTEAPAALAAAVRDFCGDALRLPPAAPIQKAA